MSDRCVLAIVLAALASGAAPAAAQFEDAPEGWSSGPQQGYAPQQGHPPQQGYAPPAAPPRPVEPPEPEEPPPPSLLETSTLAIDAAIVFGSVTYGAFDEALRSRGYHPDEGVYGGDVTVLYRVVPWLFLGGRAQVRAREWDQAGRDSIDAWALSILAIAEARLRVGRIWDVGLSVGLGGGGVGLHVNEVTEAYAAPAAWLGGVMGFRVVDPVRIYLRGGYEYLEATDINAWGHDVDLSGGSFGLGVEVRQ